MLYRRYTVSLDPAYLSADWKTVASDGLIYAAAACRRVGYRLRVQQDRTRRPISYDAMDASLQPIVAALAELGDDELSALVTTANSGPQMAPGLLEWIEHAANWEQHRGAGSDFPLQPPAAAIHRADWT